MISLVIILIHAYYIAFTNEGIVKNTEALLGAAAAEIMLCLII